MTTTTLRLPGRIERLPQLRRIVRGGLAARGSIGAGLAAKVGGAAGNGLLNNLIAYWPGNEADGGNALDAHTNALTLTRSGTVGNRPGKVYATARDYQNQSTYHRRAGDDALLSTGDVDFTLAAWVQLDTIATPSIIAGKFGTEAAGREYYFSHSNVSNRFQFVVSNTGSSFVVVVSNSFGAISTSTWYCVVCWHDSVANVIGVSVNNVSDTLSHTLGVLDGNGLFGIGIASTSGADAAIGPVAMWKSAAGGGGVLTAAQRTALYNAGNGLDYSAFTT